MIYDFFKGYNQDPEVIESKRRILRLWPDKPSTREVEDIKQRIEQIKESKKFKKKNEDLAE